MEVRTFSCTFFFINTNVCVENGVCMFVCIHNIYASGLRCHRKRCVCYRDKGKERDGPKDVSLPSFVLSHVRSQENRMETQARLLCTSLYRDTVNLQDGPALFRAHGTPGSCRQRGGGLGVFGAQVQSKWMDGVHQMLGFWSFYLPENSSVFILLLFMFPQAEFKKCTIGRHQQQHVPPMHEQKQVKSEFHFCTFNDDNTFSLI